ncbi:MAG: RimK/LysX family protein [Cyclobacteriaceae bacterium]
MEKNEKRIIGRKEKIDLPEWGILQIPGKVDTGAYNCAIHCSYSEEVLDKGKKVLEFIVLDPKNPFYKGQKIKTDQYRMKRVRNSFGQMEKRFLVKTRINLSGEEFDAGFTLSNRSTMKNPVLLGRKILKGRFLVDVGKINLSAKTSKRKNHE